jgi:hypothetical protein
MIHRTEEIDFFWVAPLEGAKNLKSHDVSADLATTYSPAS